MKNIKIHIKVDTGMNRLGIGYKQAVEQIEKIVRLRNIKPEGILTHFVESDRPGSPLGKQQVRRFKAILAALQDKGIAFKYVHCANSGGTLNIPAAYFNTVRCGLALYGYYPSKDNFYHVRLKPLLELKARIIAVRDAEKGETASYGALWTAKKRTRIAVVSVGYSDGYPRSFSNLGQAIVRGKKVPVIGRVCMNHVIINIDSVKKARPGDEVVLYGKQGKAGITLEEAAQKINTIPYELTCRIRSNIERKYIQ